MVTTEQVTEARRLCGCYKCQGGYPIGEHTIAMPGIELRPASCLAAVILLDMIGAADDLPDSPTPTRRCRFCDRPMPADGIQRCNQLNVSDCVAE